MKKYQQRQSRQLLFEKPGSFKTSHDHHMSNEQHQVLIDTFSYHKQITDEHIIKSLTPQLMCILYFRKICPNGVPLDQFLQNAIPGFQYEFFQAGKAIFHMGDKGDKFYIIIDGEAAVYVPKSLEKLEEERKDMFFISKRLIHQKELVPDERTFRAIFRQMDKNQLENEVAMLKIERPEKYFNQQFQCLFQRVHTCKLFDYFGDMALTTDKPRTATVVAKTDLHVISLTKLEFRRISERQVLKTQEKTEFFSHLFQGVSHHVLGKIGQYFKDVEFAAHQVLWQEDDEADMCTVIKHGQITLSKKNAAVGSYLFDYQKNIKFCTVSEGSMIGHEEILKKCKREYTATTDQPVLGYNISAEDFLYLLRIYPDIHRKVKERTDVKVDWLKSREQQVIETTHRSYNQYHSIGKPAQKPPERIGLKELQSYFSNIDTREKSKTLTIPSQSEMIQHKFNLQRKNQLRTEFLLGKKISKWNIEDSDDFQITKNRVVSRLALDKKDPSQKSKPIFQRSIINSFNESLRKGPNKKLYASIMVNQVEFCSGLQSDRSTSKQQALTERHMDNNYINSVIYLPNVNGTERLDQIQRPHQSSLRVEAKKEFSPTLAFQNSRDNLKRKVKDPHQRLSYEYPSGK